MRLRPLALALQCKPFNIMLLKMEHVLLVSSSVSCGARWPFFADWSLQRPATVNERGRENRQHGSAQPGPAASHWTWLDTRLRLNTWLRDWQCSGQKTLCRAGVCSHLTLWTEDLFQPKQRWLLKDGFSVFHSVCQVCLSSIKKKKKKKNWTSGCVHLYFVV